MLTMRNHARRMPPGAAWTVTGRSACPWGSHPGPHCRCQRHPRALRPHVHGSHIRPRGGATRLRGAHTSCSALTGRASDAAPAGMVSASCEESCEGVAFPSSGIVYTLARRQDRVRSQPPRRPNHPKLIGVDDGSDAQDASPCLRAAGRRCRASRRGARSALCAAESRTVEASGPADNGDGERGAHLGWYLRAHTCRCTRQG